MSPALIYTGGTIGCAGTPLTPLPFDAFQALWDAHVAPELGVARCWDWLDPPIDSTEATPTDWLRLARLVLAAEGPVVLLHGTDTLAWSGAALALLLTLYDEAGTATARHGPAVVLTGSQRPLFDGEAVAPVTDAVANLRIAFKAAAGDPGVVIAFGGQVLPGTRSMKMSSTEDRAFATPRGMALPTPLPAAIAGALSEQLDRLAPHFGGRAVLPVLASPAAPERQAAMLKAMIDSAGGSLGAIHLHGYGIGNFPAAKALAPVLRTAHEAGALIVAGSQTPMGVVDPTTYGAGSWLADCGALSALDMTPAAVDAKLHLTLALGASHNWNRAEMETCFETPVAGERRAAI